MSRDIESLPAEILVKIFRYIPTSQWASLEIVGEKFRDSIGESWKKEEKISIYDDLLASTKYFCTSYVDEEASKSVLEHLAARASNLTEIGGITKLISRRTRNSDVVCSKLAEFKSLERIRFEGGSGSLYLSDLADFLRESAARDRLLELSVGCCVCSSRQPDVQRSFADAFRNIDGRKPLRLETLRFTSNRDSMICPSNALLFSCEFLLSMDISRLTTFDASYTFVPRPALLDFVGRASNLERVSISLTCYDEWKFQSSLSASDSRRHDRPDSVQGDRALHSAILRAIGRLEHLRSLGIGTFETQDRCDCTRTLAPEMADLFRTLDDRRREENGERVFKELDLSNDVATPDFVNLIAEHLPNLDSLTLRLDHIDDRTLKRTLQSQMRLRKLRLLDHQILRGCAIAIEDILPNASTLESLFVNVPSIESIRGDLRGLEQLRRLKNFGFHVRQFRTPANIDGSILTAWGDGFGANLRSFEFGGNYSVTNDGVSEFLTKASRLELLRLDDLAMTDSILMELPTLCPLITELHLHHTPAVTRIGVQAVLDRYPRLNTLQFRGELMTDWFPQSLRLDKYRRIEFGFAFVRY